MSRKTLGWSGRWVKDASWAVSYRDIALQAAETLRLRIRVSLYKPRKNSGFVSGHRFTGHGKTQASYQGIALQAAEKLRLRIKGIALQAAERLRLHIRASLYRPRKNSGFVSGHRFTGRGKTQASYQGIALAMP
jgi:hypothetical protein